MAFERDYTGELEKTIKSCNSMKSLRTKGKQQQGLKEIYLESRNAPINILKPCRDDNEVIQALQKFNS